MLMTQENKELQVSDQEMLKVLQNSVYPGAKIESVKMVVAYCAAAKLNPLKKPVHIVPMNVKDSQTNTYAYRDVLMEGIYNYRITAHRTGKYIGKSEPHFGPVITKKFDGKEFSFPEWCKIIVYKNVKGKIAEFPSIERWEENYATSGKNSNYPNAMWAKRAYGQLAKCTEAQALRAAFPEEIGDVPTMEEMVGKTIENDFYEHEESKVDELKNIISKAAKAANSEPEITTTPVPEPEIISYTFDELKNMMIASVSIGSLNSLLPLLKDFTGPQEEVEALREIYKDILSRLKEMPIEDNL